MCRNKKQTCPSLNPKSGENKTPNSASLSKTGRRTEHWSFLQFRQQATGNKNDEYFEVTEEEALGKPRCQRTVGLMPNKCSGQRPVARWFLSLSFHHRFLLFLFFSLHDLFSRQDHPLTIPDDMNDENSQSYFYPSEQEPGYGIPGYNAYPTPMQHTAARGTFSLSSSPPLRVSI